MTEKLVECFLDMLIFNLGLTFRARGLQGSLMCSYFNFFHGIPNSICWEFCTKGVWIPYDCSSSLTPAGPIPCGKEGSGLSQCYHSFPGEPRLLGRSNPIQPSSDTEQHLYPHLCPPLFEVQMDFDGVPRWVAEPLPWYGILHGSFH